MTTSQGVVLVTGATSGIGEATANRLLAAGYRVYGTRRHGSSEPDGAFPLLSMDVDSDESVTAAVEDLIGREGRIDILVNNAGFGIAPGGAEESSIEQAKALFETNFFGVLRVTRAVLPHMRGQRSGRIINMSSVMGLMPMPYMALYSATKHAVEAYSEALDNEVRTRGIRVSLVEPAEVRTKFDAHNIGPDSPIDEYAVARTNVQQEYTRSVAEGDEPSTVANVVLKAAGAKNPSLRYTAGNTAGFVRLLRRFAANGILEPAIRKRLKLDAL